jgi:hypothetical protein
MIDAEKKTERVLRWLSELLFVRVNRVSINHVWINDIHINEDRSAPRLVDTRVIAADEAGHGPACELRQKREAMLKARFALPF